MARLGTLYTLKGARGFEQSLKRASKDVRRRVERASRETAFAVRRAARQYAPVDRGDLRAAIEAQGKGTTWRVGVVDVRIPSRGGSNSAHLNPSVYGVWYEYGFVTRRIDQHEFMGPASREEEPRHIARLNEALNGALSAVKGD